MLIDVPDGLEAKHNQAKEYVLEGKINHYSALFNADKKKISNYKMVVQIGSKVNGINRFFGHARVGFLDGKEGFLWYGFSLDDEDSMFYGHGSISKELTVYEKFVSKEFYLSFNQYVNAKRFIREKMAKKDNYYSASYSNCISFVSCVLKVAGISENIEDIFTDEELKNAGIGYKFIEYLRKLKTEQAQIENNCKKGILGNEICKQIFENSMVCNEND